MTVSTPVNPPVHAWAAWSPCDPGCVTHAADRIPATRTLRRSAAFGRALVGALARGERIAEPETLRSHAAGLLTALGIRLEVAGDTALSAPGATGTLVVANHISWLDIVALLAVEPVVMLAKREVGGWPVVGPLAKRAGTMFIDRASLRQLPDTVREMSALLRDGRSVVVFPQGITWCAGTGGRFRRATFQAAIDAGAPVRPVALEYLQHGAPTTVAAFVGEDDFGSSLRRVLRADGLTIRVRNHRPLPSVPGRDDRRTLAARAQATVCGARLPLHG
ncbi:1-acyl-sn-glycerol-3-phosphate acyltransferase [Streptomyces sp. NA02950]|uniref:lysophospholipid acyltransferase family protein n=1 Tax=Streptomyces sp. NA02950 TaxID=2742137 RepID=UPI001591617F|nr:lysophospholipid acyltransferase family protein [Streptomyces sp. NA02950]QKV91138.1 1-acyl-sn-glycerol-3-phosphate acyltransferase [Streptomyces sp. NA02950]